MLRMAMLALSGLVIAATRCSRVPHGKTSDEVEQGGPSFFGPGRGGYRGLPVWTGHKELPV